MLRLKTYRGKAPARTQRHWLHLSLRRLV